jgi:protein-S-isoprenylcysteine O-methyltransferase Ste14
MAAVTVLSLVAYLGLANRRRRRRRAVLFLSASDHPVTGVVIAVLSLGVLLARIQAEERPLGETFGAECDAYRARTWRLVLYIY